jgi:methionine-rich copper-binding protein CopC
MRKRIWVATTAIFLTMGLSAANAHTVLVAANPSSGTLVKTLPKVITLRFAEPLLTLAGKVINRVSVVDPRGQVVTGVKNLTRGTVLTNVFTINSAQSGRYKVSYRVSAQDGHVVTGTYTFTLQN